MPAVLAFVVDRIVQRRQTALLSARAVPYDAEAGPARRPALPHHLRADRLRDPGRSSASPFFASLATFWPYNLTPSFKNYDFDMMDGGGWASYCNSLTLAALTAVFGTAIIFIGAYLVEKTPRFGDRARRRAAPGAAAARGARPRARPRLHLLLQRAARTRCNFIYGTMAILVVCTIAHFYSVAHLTAVTALKQIDHEFETVVGLAAGAVLAHVLSA